MDKRLLVVGFLEFANVLGFASFIPVFPFIVERYGGSAITFGILLAIYPIFQFLAAPVLGTLSDRYGRRPILIFSQTGTLISWIVFASAYFMSHFTVFGLSLPLCVIAFARMIDGITGGNTSVGNAYLTDITPMGEKTKAFGILASIGGIGLIIGPVIGGATDSIGIGYLGPVIVSFLFSLVALVAIYEYLPETLMKHNRQSTVRLDVAKELNIFAKIGNLQSSFLKKMFFLRSYFVLAFSSYTAIIVLLIIDRFRLTSNQLGVLFLLNGTFFILNQAFIANLITKRIGVMNAYYLGHFCMMIGLFLTVFASVLPVFMVVAYLVNIGYSISYPIFRTIITDTVDGTKQGTVIGIDESVFAGASAIAPVMASFLYEYGREWAFAIFSILLIFPLIVIYIRTGSLFIKATHSAQ